MLRGRPGTPLSPADCAPCAVAATALSALWAKSGGHRRPHHPLLGHALDTAAVCHELWHRFLPTPARQQLLCWAGTRDEQGVVGWLAFLASLHDLGKASPGFQVQWLPGRRRLEALGFGFPMAARAEHDRPTLELLPPLLVSLSQPGGAVPFLGARSLAWALAGHHLPQLTPRGPRLSLARDGGDQLWGATRAELVAALACLSGGVPVPPGLAAADPGLLVALGGLTQLADWIASTPGWFPAAGVVQDWRAYWTTAQSRACRVAGLVAGAAASWCWDATASRGRSSALLHGLARLGELILALVPEPCDARAGRLSAAWSRRRDMRLQAAAAPRPWLSAFSRGPMTPLGGDH